MFTFKQGLPLNEEELKPIMLPWKCHIGHIMELCDECKNCTKFQFCTKKVEDRDIRFFVIYARVHIVTSQVINLHKPKSRITRQQECYSKTNKRHSSSF